MHNFTSKYILNWNAFLQLKALQTKNKHLFKFYQKGTYYEDTKLSDIKFVALDFETTGLDPVKNSIISIGLVPFDLQRIYCRDAKKWYINPEDNLKENSIIIHGITHSDLQGAPDLFSILGSLLEELAGKVVVVHYRRIERDFFDLNLRAQVKEGIIFPVIDTMQIEANIQKDQTHGFLNWLKGYPISSIRLANSRLRYNLPAYSPHDALTDAIATAELLQAQIKHHFSSDTAIKELWL